jgi:isopenicillin N synthase-like dioxygenase
LEVVREDFLFLVWFNMILRAVFERITHGLLKAPVHRVVSPTQGTRYSVGFFQIVAPDTRVADTKFECTYLNYQDPRKDGLSFWLVPQEILDLKQARQEREGDSTECKSHLL